MNAINLLKLLSISFGWQIGFISLVNLPVIAQEADTNLDIPDRVIQESPTLQRWLKEVPDVREDIRHDPSFRTRLRLGFTDFPSNDAAGINFGIEDIFIKRTGLTFSTDYQSAFNGDRNAFGADLHYFLLPLGNYINIAPLVGYRYVQSNDFNTDGLHLGLRLMLAFSRTGAGDISLSQSFISPGASEEVGITSLSVGYAVISNLRLSTNLEWQNSIENNDNRAGINLELLF
ncbi:MAG TPA: hypothetical protein V6C71_14995 [Coleofasciculaceae cyanobacterium]